MAGRQAEQGRMRPVVHAPDCQRDKVRCTCGATFRELMRRHQEWEASHAAMPRD